MIGYVLNLFREIWGARWVNINPPASLQKRKQQQEQQQLGKLFAIDSTRLDSTRLDPIQPDPLNEL